MALLIFESPRPAHTSVPTLFFPGKMAHCRSHIFLLLGTHITHSLLGTHIPYRRGYGWSVLALGSRGLFLDHRAIFGDLPGPRLHNSCHCKRPGGTTVKCALVGFEPTSLRLQACVCSNHCPKEETEYMQLSENLVERSQFRGSISMSGRDVVTKVRLGNIPLLPRKVCPYVCS